MKWVEKGKKRRFLPFAGDWGLQPPDDNVLS